MHRHRIIPLLVASLAAFACSPADRADTGDTTPQPRSAADSQAAHIRDVAAAGGAVDSILPIAEHLRRFRATTAGNPDTLRGGSASVDALVRRWASALTTRDTAALNAMVLDRAEFAWLYYPGSKLSMPPYEAPPELLWSQVLAGSDEGARRVLQRFGGASLVVRSFNCPRAADVEGHNRLHEGCTVRLVASGNPVPPNRYFGTIIERNGRYKFLGYANKL